MECTLTFESCYRKLSEIGTPADVILQFSDATLSTRHKHSNVSTSGSAVWEREFSLHYRHLNRF